MVDDIVDFVRGRLGCQCPPEVFQSIAVGRDPDFDVLAPGSRLIRIGGRLLVLVVSGPNIQALPAMLSELVDTGRRLRDREGFNRLRLVIAAVEPAAALRILEPPFTTAAGGDQRVHLHVIEPTELPDLEAAA
jgi:hypothetical protein